MTALRVSLAAGFVTVAGACTFPSISVSPADAGQAIQPIVDASAPDVDLGNTDADALPDSSSTVDAGAADAQTDGGACDFNGTWGSRITIDVSWMPQGLTSVILAPGTGQIRQWVRGIRTRTGNALSDQSVVCGIELPDFKGTTIALAENYGVRFPDTLFDNPGYLPIFTVSAALTPPPGGTALAPGATYSTTTTAALLGLTMDHSTTDPWPATVTTEADHDQDGHSGVTVNVAQGMPYSDIPTDLPKLLTQTPRATQLYLAIRQVTIVTATVLGCREMTGTVEISHIDSHILGCKLEDGTGCSASQATFVDNSEPIFTPSGMTEFRSIQLANGATCADVRAALP